MNIRAEKIQGNRNQLLSNSLSPQQRTNEPAFHFRDNRLAAMQIREVQKMLGGSPQSIQASSAQGMADRYVARQRPAVLNSGMNKRLPPAQKTKVEAIQLVKKEPQAIVDALGNIEFGGKGVEEKIKLNGKLQAEQGRTLKEVCLARLTRLAGQAEKFKNDENYLALQISYVTDVIGETLAKSPLVNIPRMKDRIASLLVQHFGEQINTALGKEDYKGSIATAKDLTANDPVAQYIKKMIPLKTAGEQIRSAAKKAENDPKEDPKNFMEMYIQRFKDRILSFSREEVGAGEKVYSRDTDSTFPVKELVGNISTNLHDYVNGTASSYEITENYKWEDGIDNRYEELKKEICPPEREADKEKQTDVPPYVAKFGSMLAPEDKPKAQEYWDKMAAKINEEPILIIVKAEHLKDTESPSKESGREPATRMDYKSMIEFMIRSKSVAELIKEDTESPEEIPALQQFESASQLASIGNVLKSRKRSYGPWREEKDTRAAQRQLNTGEYPTFGFIPYYPHRIVGAFINDFYGDMVLSVKNAKKTGANYKWTDQGKLHSSAGEALQDLALQDRTQLLAAATYLLHGNQTIFAGTQLEAILSGSVGIPEDIDEVIASKDSTVDAVFGKKPAKTADRTMVEDQWWWEISEFSKSLNEENLAEGIKQVFANSKEHEQIRDNINRNLKVYDDNTPEQIRKIFFLRPNPDKARIQEVRENLTTEDWRTWPGFLKKFIDEANPSSLSNPKKALGEVKKLRDQLVGAQEKRKDLSVWFREHQGSTP